MVPFTPLTEVEKAVTAAIAAERFGRSWPRSRLAGGPRRNVEEVVIPASLALDSGIWVPVVGGIRPHMIGIVQTLQEPVPIVAPRGVDDLLAAQFVHALKDAVDVLPAEFRQPFRGVPVQQ